MLFLIILDRGSFIKRGQAIGIQGVKTDYKVGIPAHSFVHSFIDDISALMSSLGGRRRVDTSNVLSDMVQVSQRMCASPWRNQLAPSISPSASTCKLLSSCVWIAWCSPLVVQVLNGCISDIGDDYPKSNLIVLRQNLKRFQRPIVSHCCWLLNCRAIQIVLFQRLIPCKIISRKCSSPQNIF